jgi:hypothetical protein
MAKSRKRSEPDTFTSNSPSAQATAEPPATASSPGFAQGASDTSASIESQQNRRDKTDDQRERVAQRAYELYLSRGGAHGSDWEDWLRAERELIANRGGESADE